MNPEKGKNRFGVSLQAVIIIMFLIGSFVSVVLLVTMYATTARYDEVEAATEDYVAAQNDVHIVRDAVNDLSERSRDFVITGNEEDVILYFNEVQVTRSREIAIEEIKNYLRGDDQVLKHLNTAVTLSERMMESQWYAMRLAIEAYGYDVNKYPPALGTVELKAEDLALEPAEQLAVARGLLFSKEYMVLKAQVDVRVELCKNQLLVAMQELHGASSDALQGLLRDQRTLIFTMILVMLLVLIFVLALVVYPVSKMITAINRGEQLTVRGSSEIMFLADTYNHMHERMEEANTKLSYEAAHDALTGLYNRSSYEEIRKQSRNRNIALLVVDVDMFKEVNDSYGHDIGDKVLIRVAHVLSDSFRDADKVCRIGGDEFAVVMMDVTGAVSEVIRRKINAAAVILGKEDGDIPPVTLSVGVAFSDQLHEHESLFKNADRALYQVKKNGRNGCGFYPEVTK